MLLSILRVPEMLVTVAGWGWRRMPHIGGDPGEEAGHAGFSAACRVSATLVG